MDHFDRKISTGPNRSILIRLEEISPKFWRNGSTLVRMLSPVALTHAHFSILQTTSSKITQKQMFHIGVPLSTMAADAFDAHQEQVG